MLTSQIVSSAPPEYAKFVLDFCSEARKFLSSPAWAEAFAGHPECDVADLIDGRLLNFCVTYPNLPHPEQFQILQQAVISLSGSGKDDGPIKSSKTSQDSITSAEGSQQDISYAVLPFTNETFDQHLAPIQLDVSRSGGKADQTSAVIFREVSHWHNQRSINQKSRVVFEKDPKIAKKALRRNQFFMAEMTSYAASLTNAVGKVLDPETITLGEKSKPSSSTKAPENKRPKQQQSKSSKNINAAKQAMLADIAANSKRKDEDNAKQLQQAWGVFCDGLEKQVDLPSRYNKARQYLANLNTDFKRQTLESEIRVYMLNILLEMWMRFCRDGAKEKGLYVAALIFDTTRALCRLPSVTKSVAASITKTVRIPSVANPSSLTCSMAWIVNFTNRQLDIRSSK